VKGLAGVKDRKIIQTLAQVLGDPSTPIRIEAAGVLSKYEKSREAAQAIVGALPSAKKQTAVAVAYLDALGGIRDWSVASVVIDHLNDNNVDICSAAIEAAGAIKNPAFVKGLIHILKDRGRGSAFASGRGEFHRNRLDLFADAQRSLMQIAGFAPAASGRPGERRQPGAGGRPGAGEAGGPGGGAGAAGGAAGRSTAPHSAEDWEEGWKVNGAQVTAKLQKEEQEELDKIAKSKRGW